MSVIIEPLPTAWRAHVSDHGFKFAPVARVVFPQGQTPEAVALARELFQALDPLSQDWHRLARPDLFAEL